MVAEELRDADIFVFTYNILFDSVLYKVVTNRPLFSDILLRLHQLQTKGCLILNVIHIARTTIINSGIDVLSRRGWIGRDDYGSKSLKV